MSTANTNAKPWILIVVLMLVTVLSRWVPHPPNMTAVGALALFAGALFGRGKGNFALAIAIPVAVLLLSDLVLGFHASMLWVYLGFALIAILGIALQPQTAWLKTFAGSLAASCIFFVVSNFGVWLTSGLYSKDFAGLSTCFALAVPFFGNQLAGDLIFVTAFALAYRMYMVSAASPAAVNMGSPAANKVLRR